MMKGLELIFEIAIHLKRRKKSWGFFIRHLRDRDKSNLNLKMNFFQLGETDA
jgi:hypothetical protein